ncbi:sugar phosphate isomerase/epimerase [Lacinutrix venerupis]|uniref:sugar phosphate isomerase/epimerase family protein n=1 Tax=Lacinutrix venerupis TaxID=1486034 RepID=UPI000EB5A09C|nr:TIM barrel protein [Lacinutrix venerupis]RLJ67366.1 sugar phosphate isomerase/epimerase [Lacinutrix venerupis]
MKHIATKYTRRDFTKLSALGLASIPLLSFTPTLTVKNFNAPKELDIHLFSKHLQFLDYDNMSAAAANMGFNGLDLTVRRKGHVLPENVISDLPKAVKAMIKHGLKPKMLSTNVWDANNVENKKVLKTASEQGFTHYRTDWLKYPENKSITDSQALFGKQATELEILNKKLGLIGGYQNHAGNHVGAPIWDLIPILEATNGKNIGCQYDIRHAVVEGSQSWELGFKRILPFINSIVLKDFIWKKVNNNWKLINVPLGEGMVDFKRYFSLLKKHNVNVPVSLHAEYDLGGAEKGSSTIKIDKKEVFNYLEKDLIFIKETWKNVK